MGKRRHPSRRHPDEAVEGADVVRLPFRWRERVEIDRPAVETDLRNQILALNLRIANLEEKLAAHLEGREYRPLYAPRDDPPQ